MIQPVADLVARSVPASLLGGLYRNTPPSMMRALSEHRFRQTVRWAATRSAFYRRAFAARGIDPRRVRTPADLGDFFTTPDDIAREPENFICRPPWIVFESSGTSGKNKQVYYDQEELREMGQSMTVGLQMMGLAPGDRVANAFDFSIWIPGLMSHYALMASGNFCMAFGKVDPLEVYRRIRQYGFNVILGEPTWMIRLTQIAEQQGPLPLKLLIGGAEEMPADAIPWMQRIWSPAKVKMCYGTVEQGSTMAFQPCESRDGYHLDDVNFLPEIIEADADGFGELVFTTLRRRVMPLIRYRTRDITRMPSERCACGLRAPRLDRLRGRRDELVVASGGNLYPLMFERILQEVDGLTHDWQVVFSLDGIREILEINVETVRTDVEALRRQVREQMAEQYPDLMKNLALGIFELRIQLHQPGSIRSGRKLRRLVDRRHFGPDALPPVPDAEPADDLMERAIK